MTNYTNLVVCVNYNNSQETMQFVHNIQKQNNNTAICVIVVENSDNTKEKIHLENLMKHDDLPDVHLVQTESNLGYLNGMFYGVQYYKAHVNQTLPKWITFCNTDIEITDANFYKKVSTHEYEESIWCIAPSVYSTTTESYQNPHYKTRISKRKLNRIIQISKNGFLFGMYTKLADLKAKEKKKEKESSQYVYAAHGCFFMLHSDFFSALKDLHYPAFLYSEEAFIAESIRENNKKVYYDDSLEVHHYEHSTTSLLGNKRRAKYIHQSLTYIRDTFYK